MNCSIPTSRELPVRLVDEGTRLPETGSMHTFQGILRRATVVNGDEISLNLNNAIPGDTEQVGVVSGMMERAHGDAIDDDRHGGVAARSTR